MVLAWEDGGFEETHHDQSPINQTNVGRTTWEWKNYARRFSKRDALFGRSLSSCLTGFASVSLDVFVFSSCHKPERAAIRLVSFGAFVRDDM